MGREGTRQFRLQTLGGLRLTTVEPEATLLDHHRKRLAILAFLAADTAGGVARDRVLATFWPESDSDRARNALNQAVFGIRRALGDDVLLGSANELRVNPQVLDVDLYRLRRAIADERLADAVAEYRGPFLDGVFLRDTPAFEQWVDMARSAYASQYALAIETLATSALAAGDHAAAIRYSRQFVAADALNARGALLLMRALDADGHHAAAVKHGELHASVVRTELGVEPNALVLSELQRLRQSAAAIASAAPAAEAPSLASPRAPRVAGGELEPTAAQSVSRPGPAAPTGAPGSRQHWAPRSRAVGAISVFVGVIVVAGLARRDLSGLGRAQQVDRTGVLAEAPTLAVGRAAAPNRVDESEPSLNIGRVLVAPLNDESHAPDSGAFGRLAGDWIATGLTQTGLVDVVDAQTVAGLQLRLAQSDTSAASETVLRRAAADAAARTLVLGRYFMTRDSLFVQVMIEDAEHGRLIRTLPTIGVRAGDHSRALALLRERVAGAFATLVDPRLESLVDRSTPAPSLRAYEDYADGLDCYLRQSKAWVGATDCSAPSHFRAAIRADSSWTLPYIWLMYSYTRVGNAAGIDSLIGILDRRHESQSELDHNSVEFFRRRQIGDAEGALRAASRAAALAPRSNWTYQAAFTAMQLGRYREALDLLRQLDPEHGWVRGWLPYIQMLTEAELMLGEYRAELRDLAQAEKRDPRNATYVAFRLDALGALGDSSAMMRLIDSLTADPPALPPLSVYINTAVHGTMGHHPQLARQVADRCLSAFDPPVISTPQQRADLHVRADCLYTEARWADARSALLRLLAEAPGPATDQETEGIERDLVNAETRLGDTAAAARHMASALTRAPAANRAADSIMMLAHMAAIRGTKARAVELLRQMPIAANWQPSAVHRNADFLDMASYPPFHRLIAPRE
jgi:DNA-binding SARP family transcriptional activator/tetratricopeptide (TPR) repeat protein